VIDEGWHRAEANVSLMQFVVAAYIFFSFQPGSHRKQVGRYRVDRRELTALNGAGCSTRAAWLLWSDQHHLVNSSEE
jgi:hypothetical protein